MIRDHFFLVKLLGDLTLSVRLNFISFLCEFNSFLSEFNYLFYSIKKPRDPGSTFVAINNFHTFKPFALKFGTDVICCSVDIVLNHLL